ncbi:tricarboxylate transport protein TctC [Pokkaliibacter plantistimulans]|uniref:Tricarboxylate transport protein TctC n=1 Tax=Pokkaliibacter plantistimulans TaxID=1635171 RepID=A0ABX5LY96_9GAMM|nr:tripartite tricarboxylate transporter substrate binding protein [Pokkaliibacter plantistimulans]PXF31662.1 tricarboxylate transport protein TctC [Pokkaliibacter plantistimulans]
MRTTKKTSLTTLLKGAAAALLAGSLSLSSAFAADFPDKDLQGVIMWGAGGATDNVARALTPHVEKYLGKKIVLTNKSGGAGAISTNYVFSRPANGYTVLYGAENPQIHGVLGLSKLDYSSFIPVNIIASGTTVIVTRADKEWKTVKDIVDDVKAHPDTIKMGTAGPGSLPFVVSSMLKTTTEMPVLTVPFDGEGPGMTALEGGHIDFMAVGLTAAREQLKAGRLKALAVVSDTAVPGMENVPLITEDFPAFKKFLPWGPFYGIFVKQGTPEEAVKALTDAFAKAVAEPQFQDFIKDFGATPLNIHGDEAVQYLKHNQSVSAWLLQDAGAAKISPEELGIPRP